VTRRDIDTWKSQKPNLYVDYNFGRRLEKKTYVETRVGTVSESLLQPNASLCPRPWLAFELASDVRAQPRTA
jgi:hypothetical protein